MSALSQIAKDPSCLLAVDALQGGRWLSCIKPDGVQPSSVPRNFVEEPETWTDFQTVQEAADWTHDYTFECTFTLTEQNKNVTVFYSTVTSCMFSIFQYNTGQVGFFTTLLKTAGDQNNYFVFLMNAADAEILWRGRHTIRIVVQGETISYYLDNELKLSRNNRIRTSKSDHTLLAPESQSGYVYGIRLVDDTTGKIVWSYPTWEERTRLLTLNNITTAGGVFRAADDAKIAGIATPLDFRGNTTSKTFIVRAFCPAHDPASKKLYIHPFFVQGSIQEGASFFTFQFSIWEDHRGGRPTRLFPAIGSGTNSLGPIVDGAEIYLDQWHTYAMVIDYNGGNCYIRAFVDGVLLQEKTVSGTPVWNTPAATTTQETTVGIRREPNTAVYAGSMTRISAALVFDCALTQPEIAALSYAVV